MVRRSNWGLLGLADDLGVYHVGGRVGASGGPRALRARLKKLVGEFSPLASMQDSGDWTPPPSKSLEPDLESAAQAVEKMQGNVDFSVVVGGGNDHAYSQLLGVARATGAKRLGCINIDAHFDLRPPEPYITSGSPFYLALEKNVVDASRLVEFGIQSHCNAPKLWDYARSKKLKIVPWEELRFKDAVKRFERELKVLSKKCDAVVICFDLDAIAHAFAPGVSAPQAEGFSVADAVGMMLVSAKNAKVCSLGLFELNPEHDQAQKTAQLAAHLVWTFTRARLGRKQR